MVKLLSIMAEDESTESEFLSDDESASEIDLTTETGKGPVYPRDYFIKEYDALRKEILWMLQDSRAVERYVVIAVGVLWAYLIKSTDQLNHANLARLAWFLPVVFSILGGLRSLALSEKFKQIGEYIKLIENGNYPLTSSRINGILKES